jgi:hypothetical protein
MTTVTWSSRRSIPIVLPPQSIEFYPSAIIYDFRLCASTTSKNLHSVNALPHRRHVRPQPSPQGDQAVCLCTASAGRESRSCRKSDEHLMPGLIHPVSSPGCSPAERFRRSAALQIGPASLQEVVAGGSQTRDRLLNLLGQLRLPNGVIRVGVEITEVIIATITRGSPKAARLLVIRQQRARPGCTPSQARFGVRPSGPRFLHAGRRHVNRSASAVLLG